MVPKICKLARSWIKNLSTSTSMDVLKGWSSNIAENILTRAGGAWSVHKKLSKHHANGNLQSTKHHRDTNSGMADEACEVHPAGNREQAFTRTDTLRARTFCHPISNRTQHITDIDPEPSYDSSARPWFLTRTWVTHKTLSTENFSTMQNLKTLEMMIAFGGLSSPSTTWRICFVWRFNQSNYAI